MLWKEITIGFLLAGFVGQLPNSFFNALFITHAPAGVKLIENAIVGPLIAILSFVCSVGNVPLAAVLWSGGISFAGVIAFIFADLIVLPIVAVYRKYYGSAYAMRIVALMFVTMVVAALIVDGLFGGAGLIPHVAPTRADIFSSIKVDYKLFTNVLGVVIFAALFALTSRRGATDPVCGMKVDRAKAIRMDFAATTFYFCGQRVRARLRGKSRQLRGARPYPSRPTLGRMSTQPLGSSGPRAAQRSTRPAGAPRPDALRGSASDGRWSRQPSRDASRYAPQPYASSLSSSRQNFGCGSLVTPAAWNIGMIRSPVSSKNDWKLCSSGHSSTTMIWPSSDP